MKKPTFRFIGNCGQTQTGENEKMKKTTFRSIGNCGQTQTGENEGEKTPPSDSLATVDRLRQVKMKEKTHHLQIHWQLWTDSDR